MPDHVSEWLEGLGLGQYASNFTDNDIDAQLLAQLTDADLKEIGISSLGHRKKLLGSIEALEHEDPIFTNITKSKDNAERRPLTIMFTDLVDSTAMSLKIDAEDLRDIIIDYQVKCARVIERFDGFVARYMGDGILSYFGYPLAHENDTERAIRAALEIVEAVRALDADIGEEKDVRLEVRVGIASGLVVVGDLIGEGASEERTVVGDTPNLAARMQGLADSNTIVIDPTARHLAGDAFNMRDLGLRDVKGFPNPIRVWQILAPKDTQSRFDTALRARQSPLVGRTEELNKLHKLWRRTRAGKGKVVMLSGDAGIGKTRLIQTAYSEMVEENTIRVRYQCSPLYTNSAFHPFIEQIEHAAGIDQAEHPDLKYEKVQSFLDQFAQNTSEYCALLTRLLSISPEGRYTKLNLGPTQLKQRTITVLSDGLMALTQNGPVLAIFEDLHWADPSSLELLDSIVLLLKDAPFMLVCTHRSEQIGRWDNLDHVTSIKLERLDDANSAELINELLEDAKLPIHLNRKVLEKTDGVPLFVEEVIRALSASAEDASSKSIPVQDVEVPNTLQSSLMSRLDRLKSAKTVAQIGAAVGRQFSYRLVEAVARLTPQDLDTALDLLQKENIVSSRGRPPESQYVFRHGLIRDVAYQSLLRRKRQEIHGRIAAALEHEFKNYWQSNPEILAHHLTETNEIEKAIVYWEAAARNATQASANIEAERHYQRAIELVHTLPDSSARAELELKLLTSMGALSVNNHGPGSLAVTELYHRCSELCEDISRGSDLVTSEEHFATLWGLWRICENLNVGMDLVDLMRTLGEQEKRPDLIMQAHHSGWATLFNMGRLIPCLESIATGEPLYDATAHREHSSLYGGHDPQVCGHAFSAVALCLRGSPDQASVHIEWAIDFAKRLNHPGSLAHALDFAATFDRMCDMPKRCLDRADVLTACSEENGFADFEIRGRAYHGWAMARLGNGEEGLEELRKSILAQRETGTSEDCSFFLEMLAEVYGLMGQPEDGLMAIDEALQYAHTNQAEFWLSATKRRQALLMVQSDANRVSDAIICLREASSVASEQQAQLLELQATLDLARLLKKTGKIADALSVIESNYDGMTEGFDLPVMVKSREFIAGCG